MNSDYAGLLVYLFFVGWFIASDTPKEVGWFVPYDDDGRCGCYVLLFIMWRYLSSGR